MVHADIWEVLSSSPAVGGGSACLSLAEVAARVVKADSEAGRLGYELEKAEIVQIQPFRLCDPRFFVHYLPARANRPQQPADCPLCLRHVLECGQNYAVVRLNEWRLTVLANPYGYMPECITWALGDHVSQECGFGDGSNSWGSVLRLMLLLCSQLGNRVIGFNELAGNSLDHLHVVSHLPVSGLGLYGVQQSAARLSRSERMGVAHLENYPAEVWRIGLEDPEEAAAAGSELVAVWKAAGGVTASANCGVAMEDGRPVLYLSARSKLLRAHGWKAKPAFLELMGVFISSDADEMAKVRAGEWGWEHFSGILSSLRPPLLAANGEQGELFAEPAARCG